MMSLENLVPLQMQSSIAQQANERKFHYLSLFKKPKEERTEIDTKHAVEFLRKIPFFSKMEEICELDQLLGDIYAAIECKSFNQGETIFHYNDKGSNFYLILEGEVDVWVPKTEEEIREDISKNENTKRKLRHSVRKSCGEFGELLQASRNSERTSLLSDQEKRVHLSDTLSLLLRPKDYIQDDFGTMIYKFKKINSLGPGAHFGEVALCTNLSQDTTTIASSSSWIATLSSENFKRICRLFRQGFREKMKFFEKFTGMSPGEPLARFFHNFKERPYSYGQKVFTQGESPDEIFVIKQGEVQVITVKSQDKIDPLIFSPRVRQTKQSFERIANMGPYTLLGEEGLEGNDYNETVTSSSNNTVLYVISLKEFLKLRFTCKDIFETVLEKQRTKITFFEARHENISSVHRAISKPASPSNDQTKGLMISNFHLSQVHGVDFFQKKLNQVSSPKSQRQSFRKSCFALEKRSEVFPESLLKDFNINTPRKSSCDHVSKIKLAPINPSETKSPNPFFEKRGSLNSLFVTKKEEKTEPNSPIHNLLYKTHVVDFSKLKRVKNFVNSLRNQRDI